MAWRIHDSVKRGEVDNRERGVVRGRIWLHGCDEAVTLELTGNACPDLAGCLLTFENPGETVPLHAGGSMHPVQRGTIGDLTASRKVRVFDMPIAQAYARLKKKLPVPEHMANCLYLEWFSEVNGRVVIESTDYRLTISPPSWRLTAGEEQQRERQAADGFTDFMNKVSEALEAQKHEPPEDKEWDEFDYEKLLRESDARTDKYMELLDKYQDHPDSERIIAREMGWSWLDEALDAEAENEAASDDAEAGKSEAKSKSHNADAADEGAEDDAGPDEPDDDPEPEPNPATEGVDWVRDEHGHVGHPLTLRVRQGSVALWKTCNDLGLGKTDDGDLCSLISEYQITGAKVAGALDGLAYDGDLREGAFIVACLKRALNHLHAAQAALGRVEAKRLLAAEILASTRDELFAVREEILRLMEEFRKK
jgi:hypothetical protein